MDSRISFRVAMHSTKAGVEIVEVSLDGQICAVIYPDDLDPQAIKLVSAHFAGDITYLNEFPDGIKMNTGENTFPPIPAVHLSFNPRRYRVEYKRLVRGR